MEPVETYLGLGTNLGERESNLAQALRLLDNAPGIRPFKCSSLYETAPWGFTEQPDFLNCVIAAETSSGPVTLLEQVKEVEQQVGREETFRYGPRVIDIDILLYGDQTINVSDPDLQIPHLRMLERAFVLVPLTEIAPELLHPVLKTSIRELCHLAEGIADIKLWGPPLKLPSFD